MADAWTMFTKTFSSIFTGWSGALDMLTSQQKHLVVALIVMAIVFVVDLIKEFKLKDGSIRDAIAKRSVVLQTVALAALIVIIILFGSYGPGFTAQDFIYMQF